MAEIIHYSILLIVIFFLQFNRIRINIFIIVKRVIQQIVRIYRNNIFSYFYMFVSTEKHFRFRGQQDRQTTEIYNVTRATRPIGTKIQFWTISKWHQHHIAQGVGVSSINGTQIIAGLK